MAFSLNETTLLSAIKGGSLTSILGSVLKPGYSLTFATIDKSSGDPLKATVGDAVFTPTSWLSCERISDASVSNAPIEKGKYTSFNKVRRPGEIRLTFTLEGWTGFSGAVPNLTNLSTLSRQKLITILDTMMGSAYTYDVSTPDTVFTSCDLTHYDYQVKADRGVTLLTVDAFFQEVITTAENVTSSNNKSSANSAMSTVTTQSSVTEATLKDVTNAITSTKATLSSVLDTTADAVTTGINSAATSVATSWASETDSVATQLTAGVKKLTSVIS